MPNVKEEPRPRLPAEIRRQVLVEAGHRCAIPTCRHIEVEVHHIIPWAACREHSYDNLIALCPNCHRRADRNDIDQKSLKLYKLNLRFAHDKFSQLEIDVLFEANACGLDQSIAWPPFMHILIKRILDAGLVELQKVNRDVAIGGRSISPVPLFITSKGQEFIENIGLSEL